MTSVDYSSITEKKPVRKLTKKLLQKAGRGFGGKITVRHKGGGHKRKYRIIDFKRHDKMGVLAKVASIEYDPNRTCFIALLNYTDGEKRYVLAADSFEVGQEIVCNSRNIGTC